jgi:hypothetical protein
MSLLGGCWNSRCATFVAGGGNNTSYAANSIFTASGTTEVDIACGHYYTNTSSAGIYTNVGAGSYYLADSSTNRGVRTTIINSNLLADLQTLATYPRVTNIYGLITNDYTLSTQVQGDTGVPDIGYHYNPIDYAVSAGNGG